MEATTPVEIADGVERFTWRSPWGAEIAARRGVVEARPNIVRLAHSRFVPESTREHARRVLVVLDLWKASSSAEDVYVGAVALDDVHQKLWGLRRLAELDSIQPATKGRLDIAMKETIAGIVERSQRRVPATKEMVDLGFPASGVFYEGTVDDYKMKCELLAFWKKHGVDDLQKALDVGLFTSSFVSGNCHKPKGE